MSAPVTGGSAAPDTVEPARLDSLLGELRWRGMLHATTPGLDARLATNRPIAGYNGFDPSGPSLHVGHLVPIFGLLQFQRHGGRPVALVGGGTGMIGDPSGRSSERNLLDAVTLEANVGAIRRQLERFLDFSPGPRAAVMANNLDWLGKVGLIEFLRDVGTHFTVPYMLAKESVQLRLERGLSFTEFSYMLLQAHDFEHLHRTMDVELQMGGADQWGNITAGLELIRRTSGAPLTDAPAAEPPGKGVDEERAGEERAHGLAYPLLLAPSGTKFGKSEAGNSIWLDPTMTSPFAFYQYWINTDDRDAALYLRWFTLFSREEIAELEAAIETRPEAREGQRRLAYDVTARTHGVEAADRARSASEAAFSREPIRDPAVLETLYGELPRFEFADTQLGAGAGPLAVAAGAFGSNGDARRQIANGALTINDVRIAAWHTPVPAPVDGRWLVLRVGRRNLRIGRRRSSD